MANLEKRLEKIETILGTIKPPFESRKPDEDLQSWMCRVIDYYDLKLEDIVPGFET